MDFIGQCPRLIYEMLFGAVSATLTEFAANPRWLGGTPAFSLVLHTWKQDLGRHVHIHALMAGGALTAAGEWTAAQARLSVSGQGAVEGVSRQVRRRLEDGARQRQAARASGRLTHGAWRELLARLHAHDWVVYAKQPLGGPAQVLEYLGRYTHRVAISNERIVGMDEDSVRFAGARFGRRAIAGARCACRRQTFIDRFLLHVLPQGFQAHPPLRLARTGGQGGEAGAGASGALGARTRSGGGGVGGGVHVSHRRASHGRAVRIVARADFVPTAAIPMPTRPALLQPADRRESAMASACFAPMPWRPEPSGIVAAIGRTKTSAAVCLPTIRTSSSRSSTTAR